MPRNIADLLVILHVLLDYGHHLTFTLEHRAAARGFSLFAQFFGTARLEVIYAHITRGMLRIIALERVLRARAARGRDVVFPKPRQRKPPGQKSDRADTGESQGEPPPNRRTQLPRPNLDGVPDLDNMPSQQQLEAEARRSPIGRTITKIVRDLGISPRLCNSGFWNLLFEAITWYNGSVPKLMGDLRGREAAFEPELRPTPQLGLPEQTRDGIRRVIGFLIGEPPVAPFPMPPPPDWAFAPRPP